MSRNPKRWTIAFAPLGDGMYQVIVRRAGLVHRFQTALPPDMSDLWNADATPSGDGENTRSFRSDPAALAPEARLYQAANLPTLKEIGDRMLACVFDLANEAEGRKIIGALEERIADNDGVEIEIDLSQTAELSGIPWESLYLKGHDRFLGIAKTSNIVRRLDTQSDLPPPIERPIRILVVAANPRDDLDTDAELGNIAKRIERLVGNGSDQFAIRTLPEATRDQFRDAVNDWQPHVIHYIGHSAFADGKGWLYFETGEEGVSDKVSAETLRNMLLNQRPWLVVLNSCQSGQTSREQPMAGVAQNLLQRINVPFVVAMQQPVSDDAAIGFSRAFYTALTQGETIASAVTIGRNAIACDEDERTQVELITPALYTSGEADGIAFVETAAAVAAPQMAAVAAATPAALEPQPGLLDRLSSETDKVYKLVGGIAGIVAIGYGAWLFAFPAPADDLQPQPQPTQIVVIDRTPGNGGEVLAGQDLSPELEAILEQIDQQPVARPPRQVAETRVLASQPVRERRVRVVRLAENSATPQAYQYVPDEPQLTGGAIHVADAPIAFEAPAAPGPVTELGPGSGGLGEPLLINPYFGYETPQWVFEDRLDRLRTPVVCDGRAATVNFELGSTQVGAEDAARLAQVAQALECPQGHLVVAGFTDTTGAPELNAELSLERAENVLYAVGWPFAENLMVRFASAYGEGDQRVATADEVEEPANRRAEVYVSFNCSSLGEVEQSVAGDEAFVPVIPVTPYPGEAGAWTPVRVVLHSRDLAGGPDAQADARLMEISQQVADGYGVPPGVIFPMRVGPACLAPGEDQRVDIDY